MKNYKQKALNGFLYKSTEPYGTSFKLKTKIGTVELWGYKPEEFKAYRNGTNATIKVIGFTNLLPDKPVIAKDKFLINIEGVTCSFAITEKPTKEVYMYLSVGKNRFVGLEDASFKESIKAVKELKKAEKEQKKKDKKKEKESKTRRNKS